MARSIHSTRRALEREKRAERPDHEKVASLQKALATKRRMKRQVRAERRAPAGADLPAVDPAGIPIRFVERSPWFDPAVDETDVRGILTALPPGTLTGVREVLVALGKREAHEIDSPFSPDPHVGRLGPEILPGIWVGRILGNYTVPDGTIRLFGYVRERKHPEWELLSPLLRLRVLSTLVHEAGHHHDHTLRVARGRWRMDDREKAETHAERMQHDWTREIVVPFLQRRHADEIRALEQWISSKTGVEIPFATLVDDPRTTAGHGMMRWVGGGSASWLSTLVRLLREGAPEAVVRREFADDLHLSDEYDLALSGIRSALRFAPDDPEALVIEACILGDLERYEEAFDRARKVTDLDPTYGRGWEQLARASRMLERWRDAEAALDCAIPLAPANARDGLRLDRIRARMELGAGAPVPPELADLERSRNRLVSEEARGLRALALLRSKRYEEALQACSPTGTTMRRQLLLAVAAEASRRLGIDRPPSIEPETVRLLRHWRLGRWIDSLLAEFPDIVQPPAARRPRVRS